MDLKSYRLSSNQYNGYRHTTYKTGSRVRLNIDCRVPIYQVLALIRRPLFNFRCSQWKLRFLERIHKAHYGIMATQNICLRMCCPVAIFLFLPSLLQETSVAGASGYAYFNSRPCVSHSPHSEFCRMDKYTLRLLNSQFIQRFKASGS